LTQQEEYIHKIIDNILDSVLGDNLSEEVSDTVLPTDICFYTRQIGCDVSGYNLKSIIEEGQFVFSNKEMGHTIFLHPEQLVEYFGGKI
jgi:hypothetical protein